MESLSMDDDRLNFLRSTPFSFSLYNRDGPNRVEIFDITRIPTCRSAISETTCLCDIFGDDCESPTLSSSPPTGSLAKVEEDKFARADDSPNDSSGSFHTANGSEQLSDSSDTFEDSKEALSPVPPPTASLPEARGASPLSKSNGLSPDPQTTPPSAQSKGTASSPRSVAPLSLSPEPRSANISPKHRTTASPHTPSIKFPSLEASCSGLSSEHRSIDISPKSEATATPYKHRSTAPPPAPRDTDVFYEATDTTPTPDDWDEWHTTEPRGTEPRITAIPPEPRSTLPELQHRVKPSRPEPSVASLQTESKPSSLELELRAEIPDSEPTNTSPKPEPRALSAEPEPRATFSEPGPRAISPEIKPRTTSPKQELSAASTEPESRVVSSKLEHSVTSLEPEPRDKSPVIKPRAIFPLKELSAILPEPEPSATSPEPEFRTQFPEPKSSDTSPEPKPSATSPEPEFRTLSPEPEPSATSPQPERCAASPEPEFRTQFPELEPSAISSEPEFRTPSPESKPSATSPEPDFKAPYPEPELSAASPEPECRTPSPEQEPSATSPEPEFRTPSLEQEPSATYPEPECRTPSPEQEPSATYPEPEFRTQYLEPEPSATSPEPEFRTPSPEPEPSATSAEPEPSATSSEPEFRTKSPESESSATSPKSEPRSTYPELNTICPSPEGRISASSPKPRGLVVSLKPNATFSSAESIETVLLRETTITAHTAESKASSPTQEPRIKDPSHEPRQTNPSLEMRSTNLSLESKTATHGLETWCSTASPEPPSTVNSHEQRNSEISSEPRRPTISAECKNPELFKLTGHAAEYAGTAAVLELGDRDQLRKPTTEPTDTSCPPKPCEREEGRMTAVLANSNASEGLQSAQPLFASETVSIRPPGNLKSEAGPSEDTAAEGPELISAPREPGVSTSGESPTVQPRQWDNSQPHRDKGQREGVEEEEEHKREERGADEGEGSREKASYEEQQVELSFSARNRRAPVSPSSAPTCRQLRTGMPAGCYSDCLLVTQQRQQQNPLRTLSSQKENRARARKPRPIPRPTRSSASQRPAPEYSSGTSSMGSELDEADDEVKWFTDQAFRSLSSPQADYLDVYNSSHRSSTNVSQLSTEDSPGATAWSAYADLQGSIRHDGDNLPHQPPAGLAPDRLDATRRFEMGSFECVDVALESREDVRRGKRTVPKRQIQLKRRDTSESQVSENDEAATDAANEAAPVQRHSRDALLRQHSTPAAIHEEPCKEVKPEPSDRKQKLQKSLSLDETSSKTKTASCLIKSVLSKKMQHNQTLAISQPPLQSRDSSSAVGKNASSESSHSVTETPKMEGSNLSSELPSDCSLSEEDLPLQVESAPQSRSVRQHRSFDPKPQPKPLGRYGYSPLQSGASSLEFQKNNTGKQGMRSELVIPFESPKTEKRSGREMWKQSSRETERQSNKEMDKQRGSEWKQGNGGVEKQRGRDWVKLPSDENLCEKHSGDSANAVSGNTGAAATRAPGAPGGMTNRNRECYTTRSENYKQQSARSTFMSKTPEIMLKPCTAREKKKSSLAMDCLSGDSAPKQEESRVAPSPERLPEKETHKHEMESKTEDRPENGEAFEKNRPRAPVHKVRDVRKLVKNTYNLSFKATAVPAQDSAPRAEVEKPPPMQIEYVSRKVEGLATSRPGERQAEGEKAQVPVQLHSQEPAQVSAQVHPQVPVQVHSQEPTQVSAQVHPQVPVQVHSQEPTQVSAQVHPQGPPQVSAQVQPQVPVQVPPQKVTQTASLHITPRGRLTEAGAAAPDTAATEANTSGVSESASRIERVPGGGTRHPKLGSTPKLPSKDREVSTLMFLQNGPPEGGLEPGALPPLALTATSCSRSVSMLLKEKGFQADIGVYDAPADDPNATEKHVNTLEVPLQTCSAEEASSGPSDPVPPPARSSPSAPTPLMDPKEERHPRNPTPPQLRELDLERTSLKPRENNTRAQDPTPSSPQTPAATYSDRPQLTHVKTVSTCTRKPAPAATGSPTSSCKQQSASAAAQLHSSDTQTSAPLAASSKENQPALSAISSCKQKPPLTSSPEQPNLTHSDAQEQVALVSSCSSSCSQSSVSTAAQSPSCSQQSTISITSTKRIESSNLRYYASDDPPSYDERESFSPLLLTDLYSRKPNRYHPPAQAPPCSCAADGVPCPGPPDITPLVPGPSTAQAPPSHTQAPPSLAAPPPARHHHQRSDGRSLSYKPGSPKGAPPSLAQAPPHPFQPLHHPPPGLPACPPLLPQPRPENSRQPPPGQQADRRPGQQRSPQHPASLSGSSTYSSHSTHSPGVPPLEVRPQYLCTPPGFVSPYGSEYGGEGGGGSGMLYPEGGGGLGYGQSPRRVLLDPETGKYFYIEVPMQPLRKMLFDPETGQYVEVLIPQQTLSHSGLYPPVAAPYPSMHNPGMYAPQYLPYSVPPHSQPPSPRHAEAPPPQGLHQSNGGFGTPSNQSPKTEPQNHPPLDQSYLESMYYIPTGMTASPNPAPPEFYQKLPPSLPNSGGKRS